jgi:hypothetical protein
VQCVRNGWKAVDNCDLTKSANAWPHDSLKVAIGLLGTDALFAPHNPQISGVAEVARLLRQQKA